MANYVMSDIHGQYNAYLQMLEKIQFSEQDQLYIIGDVIDRGKGGIDILKHIIEQHNIVLLRGNHEQMMLDSRTDPLERDNWLHNNGGNKTWKAFKYKTDRKTQLLIYRYLDETPSELQIEVNGVQFHLVHAKPGSKEDRLWGRFRSKWAYKFDTGDKVVITGHTPTNNYITPYNDTEGNKEKLLTIMIGENGLIGMDCGCSFGRFPGQLACLRLEDWVEYYIEI